MYEFKATPEFQGEGEFSFTREIIPDEETRRPSIRHLAKGVFSRKKSKQSSKPTMTVEVMQMNEPSCLQVNFPIIQGPVDRNCEGHPEKRRSNSISGPPRLPPITLDDRGLLSRDSNSDSAHTRSTSSTTFSQFAYTFDSNTDTTLSINSTPPRDQPLNTSYFTKRAGVNFSSVTESPLIQNASPTTQTDEIDGVDIGSFPMPPLSPYHNHPNLNPKLSLPILKAFAPVLSPPPTCPLPPIPITKNKTARTEIGAQHVSESNITWSHPQKVIVANKSGNHSQKKDQDPTDYQMFLVQSHARDHSSQKRASPSIKSSHSSQLAHKLSKTSKGLDDSKASHQVKRTGSSSNMSTVAYQNTRQPSVTVESAIDIESTTQFAFYATQNQSRFFTDSRFVTPRSESRTAAHSTTSSLYGNMREYLLPALSAKSGMKELRVNGKSITPVSSECPRLFPVDIRNAATQSERATATAARDKARLLLNKSRACTSAGIDDQRGREERGRVWNWSKVGRAVKRSLSLDREKENSLTDYGLPINNKRYVSAENGVRMTDQKMADPGATVMKRGELRRASGGENTERRKSLKLMPTSIGLERYNLSIDRREENSGYKAESLLVR